MDPACSVCKSPIRDRKKRLMLYGPTERAKDVRSGILIYYKDELGQNIAVEDVFPPVSSTYVCQECCNFFIELPKLKVRWEQALKFCRTTLPAASPADNGTPAVRMRTPLRTPLASSEREQAISCKCTCR